MFDEKTVLRIPGPTPVPPEVTRAMTHSMIGHRSGDFSTLFKEVQENLRELFQTSGDVAVIAGTGTAGLEAAVYSMVQQGDRVLAISTGNFGDRFTDIARRTESEVLTMNCKWGTSANVQEIVETLQQYPDIQVVLLTHCETSTGVLNDVKEIARVTHEHGAYLIVDAVSSFVGSPLLMDEWHVDIVVTGSQKALGLPPGLALVAMGPRAIERMKEGPAARSFYFDLRRYQKDISASTTPWTPPVSLIYGLRQSVSMILAEGLQKTQDRHRLLRDMTRAGIRALGLTLMVEDDHMASHTVTTVFVNHADEVRKIMKNDLHLAVAGGQKQLAGKIIRIGHMGYVDASDVLQCLATLEIALVKTGYDITLGTGVGAAAEVYVHAENTRN
ncbi:MAG: alanine--glyoxylate aminotransferase family protein [Acidibacillus sp.]|nr:alanine--glyoxylate aminotransferase family protein [Acidibacillus sp.]